MYSRLTTSLLLPLLVWSCSPNPGSRQLAPVETERAAFAAPG
jgi:hypothetical protein